MGHLINVLCILYSYATNTLQLTLGQEHVCTSSPPSYPPLPHAVNTHLPQHFTTIAWTDCCILTTIYHLYIPLYHGLEYSVYIAVPYCNIKTSLH